jgi:hypothetical protein
MAEKLTDNKNIFLTTESERLAVTPHTQHLYKDADAGFLFYGDGSTVGGTSVDVRPATTKTANYTLLRKDEGRLIVFNSGSGLTLTIPTNANVPFVNNLTEIHVLNIGAGAVTLSGASGVTVSGTTSLAQYAKATIRKTGTDAWVVLASVAASTGDIEGVTAGTGLGGGGTSGTVTLTNTGVTSIVAGTNISISGATGAVTITGTDTNTQLTTEQVQDIVGDMLVGTETRIGVSYDDTNGRINFVVDDMTANTQLTTEEVQDIIGAMIAGNTESGITVTYDDTNGKLDLSVASQTENSFTTTLKNKLEAIEANATADQTAAEIRALVEAATDSNVFTDADHSKLNAIEASATADQTASEIRTLVESATDSNVFTDADHSKLDGIAASANNYAISSDLLDEDNMASNSATKVASQQSIKTYVDAEVAGVVDSAPAALNTLNELAAALGDDANYATTTSTALGNRLRTDTDSQGLNATQQTNALTNLGITATKAEINILDDGLSASDIPSLAASKITSGTFATARIADDAITAGKLNVTGDGSATQFLRSDGDGSFTWAVPTDTDTNTQLTQEQVEDFVAGVITAGTNVSVTYDDAAGTLTIASTDTNTQLTTEAVQDIVGAMLVGTETRIGVTYDDTNGRIDFVVDDMTANDNTQLTNEQVQDIVGAMFSSNTETRITATYDDTNGKMNLVVDDQSSDNNTTYSISAVDGDNADEEKIRLTDSASGTDDIVLEAGTGLSIARSGDKITFTNTVTDTNTQLTTEQVQDIIGAMFSSNTETRVAATYDDTNGKIDIVVDDMTADTNTFRTITAGGNTLGSSETLAFTAGSNVTITESGGAVTIASTDTNTNTQLSDEQVQDIIGAMVDGGTETNISVTYDDTNGKLNFVSTDTNTEYSVGDGGLTQNNFTNTLKTKLDGIATSANNYVHPNHSGEVTSSADGATVIADNVIDEANLKVTNSPTDNYLLSYDQATTGFTWIAAGAGGENNQNAFSTVAVSGQDDVVADAATDTLTFAAGSNVTITTTAGSDTITFASADTNTQLTQEQVEDYVNGLIVGGTNVTATYDDAAGTLTLSSSDTNTQLSTEEVQDIVGAMLVGTETRIGVTYDDTNGRINFVVDDMTADTQPLTTEAVQDIVGDMFASNTETRVAATYDDTNGKINVVVDDMTANDNTFRTITAGGNTLGATETLAFTAGSNVTITESGGAVTITSADTNTNTQLSQEQVEDYIDGLLTAGSNVSLTYDDVAGTLTIASTDTNTQLSTEQVQDIVGAMFSSNTETRISATYQDGDGTIDLVVDDLNTNTQLSNEQVQDIVGAMFSSNTETRVAATYDDTNGKINVVVDDMTANDNTFRTITAGGNTLGSSETLAFTAGTNVSISESGGAVTITSTDTNTEYSVGDGGLTQNNFTNTLKSKLDGIASSANNYAISSDLLDEDNMASNSATKVASQQSIKAYVDAEVATNASAITAITNGAPSLLNTLDELAAALGDDANFATTTATSLGEKLVKTSNLSDLANAGTARTNLGLGTAATLSGTGAVANGNAGLVTGDVVFDYIAAQGFGSGSGDITAVVAGTGLSGGATSGSATVNLSHLGIESLSDPNGDRLLIWDDSAGAIVFATANSNLAISGTNVNATDTNTTYSVGDGGLTQNNFTNTLKTKLDGIAASANNYSLTDDLASGEITQLQNIGATTITATQWGYLGAASGAITNTDTQLSTEQVQDIVGAMFSSNTETRVSATYQDGDGTIDLVVDDMTANDNTFRTVTAGGNTLGASETLAFTAGSNVTITELDGAVTIAATDTNTNTQLSTEQVQDIVGAMFSSNTETRIAATYQDGDGTIDLVVDDMTANTNTNQLTTFTLTGDSGTNQTIAHGNTLDIAGGTGIDTVVGATDTVTVAIDNTVATLSGSQTLSNKTIAISQVTELSNLTAAEGEQLENIGSTTISATQWGYLGAASGAITNTDTQLSTEQVQDIVGAMFSSNTETRVSATYQDGDGTIDLVVDDMTANDNTTYSAGTNISLSGTTFNVDDAFLVNNGDDTTTGTITAGGFTTAGSITLGGHAVADIDIGSEFVDTDDHLMSSGAIKEKIESYSYVTANQNTTGSAGTVTSIGNLTGEVTSTNRATVIADNVVDEANLKVSNNPTNGYVLTAQSGNTGGLTWAEASSGGASDIGALDDVLMDATNFISSFLIQTDSDGSAPTTGTLSNASHNIGIGHDVFLDLTSGVGNLGLGTFALTNQTTGDYNIGLGYNALGTTTQGQYNIGIGYEAGFGFDDHDYNVAIGYRAFRQQGGSSNVAVGSFAMYGAGASNTASNNVALGTRSMEAVTTGSNSVFVGYQAGSDITTASSNVGVGYQALYKQTTGLRNVAVGANALDQSTTEADNIAIGYNALGGVVNGGEQNVAIGSYSGEDITTADGSVLIGYRAGWNITTGGHNVAIGHQALDAVTTNGQNVAVGMSALGQCTSGNNVAVGADAGRALTSGGQNVFVGYATGYYATSTANTLVGYGAGDNVTSGGNNTLIGVTAGGAINTGTDNIMLGKNAGDNITSGDNNVIIGAIDADSATADDQLIIASGDGGVTWIKGDSNGGIASKAQVVAVTGTTQLTAAQSGSYVYVTGSGAVELPDNATVGLQYTIFNNKGSDLTVTLGTNNSIVSNWATNAAVADNEATSYICVSATNWVQVG